MIGAVALRRNRAVLPCGIAFHHQLVAAASRAYL
jgi:hypothetical protein